MCSLCKLITGPAIQPGHTFFHPALFSIDQRIARMASAAFRIVLVSAFSFLLLPSASSLPVAETIDDFPQSSSKISRDGELRRVAAGGSGCWYTVSIKTSCSSPRYTRDRISLDFGDAYGNDVYAPRLDDPSAYTFERCSTDTFRLAGPCGYGVCYLYLYRDGRDGWIPEWVKVVDPYYGPRPLTFYYGSPIPNAIWYGFNNCHPRSSSSSSSSDKQQHSTAEEAGMVETGGELISQA